MRRKIVLSKGREDGPEYHEGPVPGVREENEVVIIAASDLHLSHTAPSFRAEKGDKWYEVMKGYLDQLRKIQKDRPNSTIVYAGDIFHTWKEPAELVNFAIRYLPEGYAIPGQHDLPYHRYDLIEKSPYWTLCHAGVIENLPPTCPTYVGRNNVLLHAFPWGWDIVSCDTRRKEYEPEGQLLEGLQVAVVHKYVWVEGAKYPNAPDASRLKAFHDVLDGYKVALFGDNHKGFLFPTGKTAVMNCGTFIRRRADEVDYRPHVGLVTAGGKVAPYFLDVSKDEFVDTTTLDNTLTERGVDPEWGKAFLAAYSGMSNVAVDFVEAVRRYMEDSDVSEAVRDAVLKTLDEGRK